jgi:type II secretory pathway component GspD/PulD (secretin)
MVTFFKTAGVDLSPPKTLFYNNRLGTLMIRATLQDLDIVEQAVQVLNMAPPQVTIECKFVEFPVAGSLTTWLQQRGLRLAGKPVPADRSSTNTSPPSSLEVLTPALYRELLKLTEQEPGANNLAPPRITTLSGRQAQIKVVDVKSIVTDLDYHHNTNGAAPVVQPITEKVELGLCIDVVPYVSADGYTISLTVIPSIKEFLGYDRENAKKMLNLVPSMGVEYPLPMFRHRTAFSSSIVWDGQTVLLYLGSFESIPGSGSKTTNHRIVLVTPTIIDPAGNAIHTDKDAPFRTKRTPRQPTSKPGN